MFGILNKGMLKHKLIINYLNRELSKLYLKYGDTCPDSGGCGLIAHFIYEGFESLGYNPRIQVVTGDWCVPSSSVIQAAQDLILSKDNSRIQTNFDLDDLGVTTTHVMIKFNNYYIDLSGCYSNLNEMKYWPSMSDNAFLTPEILKRIAYNPTGWNYVFDRERAPDIKADIDIVFKKLGSLIKTNESIERYYKLMDEGRLLSA